MIDFDDIARTIGYSSAKSMLEDMYITKNMSLLDISEVLGVNRNTVTNKLRLAGIPIKLRGHGAHKGSPPNKLLESIPLSRLGRAKIATVAKVLDLAPSTIYEYLRKKGLPKVGPQHNPHPGYSRKKGSHTPRAIAVEEVAEVIISTVSDVQPEGLEEEKKDEGQTEDRGEGQ